MNKKTLTSLLLAALTLPAFSAEAPAPCGAVPTPQQVDWLRMEWYGFVHFGLNTYTGKEWGYGDESPTLFNPTDFDASAIAKTFKKAGMTGMIYTAKHHDGWCAWPSSSTTHNIKKSPWKNGKGDVVKEFAKACKKNGIKFGVYISPWDRNCADYGKKGYLRVYYKQIQELLTKYGPVFEIWFDGANGGNGYYGGAKEHRNIGNASDYYNFPKIVKNIRKLQPDCIIWGAGQHGDVIWGGSEKGHVKYPCWNVVQKDTPNERWISLEGDTPINGAGWFWHANQAPRVKSPEHLMQVYLDSVGRGANLILNVAPDKTGRLDAADVESLLTFGKMRRALLAHDFALGAKASATTVRGDDAKFGANNVTDGDIESYWCTNDGEKTGSIEINLPKPATFDVVRVREQIRLGQRVSAFTIDAFIDGQWQEIDGGGQTIGNQVMRKLNTPVTTDRVRLNIKESRACPCISELSLLRMPSTDGTPAEEYVFEFNAAKKNWSVTPESAAAAFDNNPDTFWQGANNEAIVVDMKKTMKVSSFSYLPRQDGNLQNMTDSYEFATSVDGKKWKTIKGEFSNLRANPIELTIDLPEPTDARYFRFTPTRALEGSGASAAEINVK